MEINKRKLSIPWGFIIGIIFIFIAWIIGGSSLAISAAWRWLLGLSTGIASLIIFSGVKKARAKRK